MEIEIFSQFSPFAGYQNGDVGKMPTSISPENFNPLKIQAHPFSWQKGVNKNPGIKNSGISTERWKSRPYKSGWPETEKGWRRAESTQNYYFIPTSCTIDPQRKNLAGVSFALRLSNSDPDYDRFNPSPCTSRQYKRKFDLSQNAAPTNEINPSCQ